MKRNYNLAAIALANPDVSVPAADQAALEAAAKGKRTNKYGNKKVVVDGIKFDSQAEMQHWFDLSILERAGQIRNLELQPEYKLPGGVTYRADFRYEANGMTIVEDVKSPATAKEKSFRIKWKQAQELYPDIEWRLVTTG